MNRDLILENGGVGHVPAMDPVILLERCGFARSSADAPADGHSTMSSETHLRFEPLWGNRSASIEVVVDPGVRTFRAVVDGVGSAPLHYRTEDVRDVVALAAALQNVVDDAPGSDPAAVMDGPLGPVSNPFGRDDGGWAVHRSCDVLSIDDPVGRWGGVYEDYREDLAARYRGRPLAGSSVDYLWASGFRPSGDTASVFEVRPMKDFVAHQHEASETLTFVVYDEVTRRRPDADTKRYHVTCIDSTDGVLDVAYVATDVRDVLAFVDACCNNVVFGLHGIQVPEGRSFAHERSSTAVYNPFADAQYGDWNVVSQTDSRIVVGDPWRVFGHEYFAWRDHRVEQIYNAPIDPSYRSLEFRP